MIESESLQKVFLLPDEAVTFAPLVAAI